MGRSKFLRMYNVWGQRSKVLRWKKFAPGPVRIISAAGIQSAQRIQAAANKARLRARAVAAPVRANVLPLPPPVEVEVQVEDVAPPPVPARALGCTKCRFQVTGCKQCQNPSYVPRGKGRGKAQPKAQAAKAKANAGNGRGRAKGRGRGK